MKIKEKQQRRQNLWATQSERLLRPTLYFCSKKKQKPQNVLPCRNSSHLILLPCPAQHCPIIIFLHRDWWNSNYCELIYIISVTKFWEWCWRVVLLPPGNSKQHLTFSYGNHVLDVQQDSELGKTFGRPGRHAVLHAALAGWAVALPQKRGKSLQHQQPHSSSAPAAWATREAVREFGQGSLSPPPRLQDNASSEGKRGQDLSCHGHGGIVRTCLGRRSEAGDGGKQSQNLVAWPDPQHPAQRLLSHRHWGTTTILPRPPLRAGGQQVPGCPPQHGQEPPENRSPALPRQPAPVPLWEGPGVFGQMRRYFSPPVYLNTIIWLGQPGDINLSFTGMTYLFST